MRSSSLLVAAGRRDRSIPAGLRDRQKMERERRILAAARKLFDRRGYVNTSMGDVAARAGLAVGTLYNYFSSKDQLLIALSRIDTEYLLSAGARILAAPPDDPADAIGALTEVMVPRTTAADRRLRRELFLA